MALDFTYRLSHIFSRIKKAQNSSENAFQIPEWDRLGLVAYAGWYAALILINSSTMKTNSTINSKIFDSGQIGKRFEIHPRVPGMFLIIDSILSTMLNSAFG